MTQLRQKKGILALPAPPILKDHWLARRSPLQFASPPAHEVGIHIALDGRQAASSYRLTDFHDLVRDKLPVPERALPAGGSEILQLRGIEPLNMAPWVDRWFLKSSDDSQLLQLQDNMIGYNWRRSPGSVGQTPYPGYSVMKDTFMRYVDQLKNWHIANDIGFCDPMAAELFYDNIIDIPAPDENNERTYLADIFEFWKKPVNELPTMYAWNTSWVEALTDLLPPDGPMLKFSALAGSTTEDPLQPPRQFMRLQIVASGMYSNWEDVYAFLDIAHDNISRRFGEIVNSNISNSWT
jgi:uncharacterized protein (TIGR04255 family)